MDLLAAVSQVLPRICFKAAAAASDRSHILAVSDLRWSSLVLWCVFVSDAAGSDPKTLSQWRLDGLYPSEFIRQLEAACSAPSEIPPYQPPPPGSEAATSAAAPPPAFRAALQYFQLPAGLIVPLVKVCVGGCGGVRTPWCVCVWILLSMLCIFSPHPRILTGHRHGIRARRPQAAQAGWPSKCRGCRRQDSRRHRGRCCALPTPPPISALCSALCSFAAGVSGESKNNARQRRLGARRTAAVLRVRMPPQHLCMCRVD